MADESNAASGNIARFQDLLRELFQFDCADLDFGIYRIMNHKRDAIERFITEKLPAAISTELEQGALAQQAEDADALDKARGNVLSALGENAFDASGELVEVYHDTPFGKAYREAKARAGASRTSGAVADSVYNHLYTFFSRYYDEGDFISQRRYSRSQRYAIPYNGEEVYLHWANSDQYYVKTDEHFRNYDWVAPNGVSVHFRLQNADVEQNNVKGDRRFFLSLLDGIEWDATARAVTIPFEYRPLTGAEKAHYGTQGQQDRIITRAVEDIPGLLGDAPEAIGALSAEHRRNGNGPVSRLQHHLVRYTRRNNSDFFIHKDLAGFLNRELDFYLKNEVLSLDEIASAGENMADGWFQQLRLIKAIGGKVIDFLAQVEDFQKMLWEKRKFVTEAQYCITLGNVDAAFYADVVANDAQWDEWRELFDIDGNNRSAAFLQAHPTLVLDTKHYDTAFTDRLLASFGKLDEIIDGLVVHSENWQGLNLLSDEFWRGVDCVYIDPPYNTGDSEILYKNGYLNSSWLTLIYNRLQLTLSLLSDDATSFIAIDDFEMADLCELIDKYFQWRREMIIVNHHPQGGKAQTLSTTHEYMIACVNPNSSRSLAGRMTNDGVERRPFQRAGTAESNFRYARPNSFYAILIEPETNKVIGLEPPPDRDVTDYPTAPTEDGYTRIYPISTSGDERVWRNSYESALVLVTRGKLECTINHTIYQLIEASERRAALFSNWIDTRYNAGTHGANLLADIVGERNSFPYPKSVHTVGDAIFAVGMESGSYCLDYFAGSGTTGHAVINLNREDGGERKFILVEMGEYFDTVLLPRIKKVTFAPEWKNGKPQREATAEEAERSPRIMKYVRLESYEDALDSIAFDDAAGQMRLAEEPDEYLLKYMLQWETKASETLLNAAKLTSPFTYRLRVHVNGEKQERAVDVPETFNYLLGLNVRTRRTYDDVGRRYLVFRGEARAEPGREVAIIWRETAGWTEDDFERDRAFVAERELAAGAVVYVNGDSAIPDARPIEPLFKARMFADVNAG